MKINAPGWKREWWYRISFEIDEKPLGQNERFLLVFQGLDTFVTIWLNGEEIGRHENMFREAVFDVSQRLRTEGPNTLALCFHPPLQQIEKAPFETWGRNPERAMMRKAQFGYGWDWGPRLPTIGIWRPVELCRQHSATIQGVHFSTLERDTNNNAVLVSVQVDVERFAGDQAPTLSIALLPPDNTQGTATVAEQTLTLQESGSQLSAYELCDQIGILVWHAHLATERLLARLKLEYPGLLWFRQSWLLLHPQGLCSSIGLFSGARRWWRRTMDY
jgi:beta-mannosidase